MDDIAILIPAYEPDEQLPRFVAAIRRTFRHVVVVDDGSATGSGAFTAVRPNVDVVLVHPRNRGKGAALRTGLAWIRDNLPDVRGVVTADADGQHRPHDVLRVAMALRSRTGGIVLGVRAFSGNVPLRSRFGNWWARQIFRLLTGASVADTQTGLRGIPRDLFAQMLAIPGDRYEYEMEMLAQAATLPQPPLQISIETVYIAANKSSHFQPFRDTLRTQGVMFRHFFRRKLTHAYTRRRG